MRRLFPKPQPSEIALPAKPRAGVLLPRPLAGAYDYKLETALPRGSLVLAPLGSSEMLGVVWGEAEGAVGDNRLKIAQALDGGAALPENLCDFIDWIAGSRSEGGSGELSLGYPIAPPFSHLTL